MKDIKQNVNQNTKQNAKQNAKQNIKQSIKNLNDNEALQNMISRDEVLRVVKSVLKENNVSGHIINAVVYAILKIDTANETIGKILNEIAEDIEQPTIPNDLSKDFLNAIFPANFNKDDVEIEWGSIKDALKGGA